MVKTTGGGVTEARKAKLGAAKVEITEKTPQPTDEWVSKLARAAVAKRAPLMSERERDKRARSPPHSLKTRNCWRNMGTRRGRLRFGTN